MKHSSTSYLYIILLFLTVSGFAQQKATIRGTITDENGRALFSASVAIEGTIYGAVTDTEGKYSIDVPANEVLNLVINYLGYQTTHDTLILAPGEVFNLSKSLLPDVKHLDDVEILGIRDRENTLIRLDIKSIDQLPSVSQNIEALIKTLPGVGSGNELSSQYSVRGGSFEENLIYVNDIEIYRPLLVQSAQQEGLSFVNPSLVSSIQFSAGGFNAEYGDKLSSVLDIRYKQPTRFGGSAMASLLGGSAHIEGSAKNNRFTYITGIRYKTTKYLLGTLDTKADYNPSFIDFQTYLTYDITEKLELSFLGNYATNQFNRVPKDRSTNFGTFQQGFNFIAYYEGQEEDKFDTYLGALSLNYKPHDNLSLKFIGTGFRSNERITYDILRQYYINLATQGSTGSRDSLINIGIGSSLDHARDYLKASIYSLEHRGTFYSDKGILKWGLKGQQEIIDDDINEWEFIDSAGMSLPFSNESVDLSEVNNRAHLLNTGRFAAFIQHTFNISNDSSDMSLTFGLRGQYWTLNKNLTLSPRINFSFQTDKMPRLNWHFATGLYYQPPFYKEIRDPYGNLYPDTKAQRAFHFVAGADYKFRAWDRPFVFTSEIYYKHLTHLIPYKLDDVRLDYLPNEMARGYATGIDFKVYGEFVPGSESWFSLSLLHTKEDIYNDYLVNLDKSVTYPEYYRRPTDQIMSVAIFFQDYLPSNPNYKMHLMLIYGTGLPYSGPLYSRPADVYELGPYRRIDIGFSRVIVRDPDNNSGINSIWISAEILNLLDARNVVSYDWMRTVESDIGLDTYFAVPNYLTGRSFNIKISVDFSNEKRVLQKN